MFENKKTLIPILVITLILTFYFEVNAIENDIELSFVGEQTNESSLEFFSEIDGYSYKSNLSSSLELGLDYNFKKELTGNKENFFYVKPTLILEENYPNLKNAYTGLEATYKFNQDKDYLIEIKPYFKAQRNIIDRLKGELEIGGRLKEGEEKTKDFFIKPSLNYKYMFTPNFHFDINGETEFSKEEETKDWKNNYEINPKLKQIIELNNYQITGEVNYFLNSEENKTNLKLSFEFN